MNTLNFIGVQGTNAVRKLREQKLRSGLPFMINVQELATNQCYLEFPDRSVKLVTILSSTRDIDVIRELSSAEADLLRRRFHFA